MNKNLLLFSNTVNGITKDGFITLILRYLGGEASLTEQELGCVFDYIDLDLSGSVSQRELAVNLSFLPEVALPRSHILKSDSEPRVL